ncbi:MAG TPA: glycosyltransferase family 39 protein [Salinivirgaceae bacterium]|nr:glycosyltransferase family 39 protein [Salinivirgaceae bacterium]
MQKIKENVRQYWHKHPLRFVLILGFVLRLTAAIFSGGYGMHDDHFLVIETAQSWVDGTDYNNWLPQSQLKDDPTKEPKPDGHSLFYPGLNYLFFYALDAIGMTDFSTKMVFLRLLHALFSLLVIYAGFRIAQILSDINTARFVGLLLATFWWMPFFAVRNLVEVVAIPFVMMGFLWLLEAERTLSWAKFFWGSFILGLAFNIRFQTIILAGGLGLYFLYRQQWRQLFMVAFSYLLAIVIVQAGIDFFIWKRPFAELVEYVLYNMEHKYDYGSNRYSMYFLVLIGFMLPPIGIMWFYGWLRSYKHSLMLWLATVSFFLFHTLFPNKQERFIITIAPMVLVLGVIAWEDYRKKSAFWQRKSSLHKGFMKTFWILNIVLLIPLTLTFSKRSRVVSFEYLSSFKDQIHSILIEDTNRNSVPFFPLAYLEKWVPVYNLAEADTTKDRTSIEKRATWNFQIYSAEYFSSTQKPFPDFVLFMGNKNLEQRVKSMQAYCDLEFMTEIKAGFVDRIMATLNPKNVNESVFIYRVKKASEIKVKPKCCR